MNQQPKVSIVVPIYNVESYLERCIQTLLNQTLKDIEIILIDDGSPDHCPQICNEYAQKDSRIKVIHKKNAGLGYARNSGLEIARGKYLAFVDSDDYVEANMYEILYNKIKDSNSDVVFCNYKENYGNGYYVEKKDFTQEMIFLEDDINDFSLDSIASAPGIKKERKFAFSVWRGLFRNDIIKKNNLQFVSERRYVSEDIPFLLDYFHYCKKITFIPHILYVYTQTNQTSLTRLLSKEKIEATVNLYYLLNKKMQNTDTAKERTTRMLIGIFRTYSYQICRNKTNLLNKIAQIKVLNSHPIWKEIYSYPYNGLPYYNSIILFLQKNRLNLTLIIFLSILDKIKK